MKLFWPLLMVLLAGCGTGAMYPAAPTVELESGAAQMVQIFANGDWRDTGIQVRRGASYRLEAEGTWSSGLACGTTDASGAGVSPLCGGDPWGIGAVGSSLIGRIGLQGTPFPVGKAKTLVAPADGRLFLRDYDIIEFDNVGSVMVTITATAPASQSAQTRQPSPQSAVAASPPKSPPRPHFAKGPERPDDVAVIIGNGDYSHLGKDIPDVKPAQSDAEAMRVYATEALGIRDGNIIFLKDATGAQMTRVFGSKDDPRGQLSDWVKPGKSRVFVYFSGHGAPGGQSGSPYLIPVDADAARIELNGYPLKTLYDNLGKLPAQNVTVVLEACFSGLSPAGSVLSKASPIYFEVKAPPVPANLTIIAAGAANQIASWDSDESSGLFTRYFLEGMAGKADLNGDGRVTLDELDRYLRDTLSYYARRYYGRDQQAQILRGGGQ